MNVYKATEVITCEEDGNGRRRKKNKERELKIEERWRKSEGL